MENNQLYHHGTKGMKWGVRRFQRKDGSLTPAGKKRYNDPKQSGKSTSSKGKTTSKKKSVGEMSDAELNKAIKRAQLEDQYKALRPEQVSTGKKFISGLINKVIAPAAANAGKEFLENALKKYGKQLLGEDEQPVSEIDKLKKEYEKLDLKSKIDKLKNPEKNWENELKRQKYEENERNRKKAEEADNNKKDDNRADNESKKFNDDYTVYDAYYVNTGSSTNRKGSTPYNNTDKNQYKTSSKTIYDAEWEDATDSTRSSGSSFVSSLPSGSKTSRPSIESGSTFIAGLLPAPKDDD